MTRSFPADYSLSASGCILGALALLILPLKFLVSAFLAAAVHECCHLIALKLCRVPILSVKIRAGGAVIETAPLAPLQELFCAMAGPAGSLLCLLLAGQFPLVALCGFLQGIYNLLPVYPLDGGRMLRCAAMLLLPVHADRLCEAAKCLVIAAVAFLSVWLTYQTSAPVFLLLGGYFLLRTLPKRKIPCKAGGHWVQ